MKTKNAISCGQFIGKAGRLEKLVSTFRLALLTGLAALGMSRVQAQLYYDPNDTGGTALGGNGGWYSYYWDGTNDVGWDGVSPTVYSGTPGTVTLEAEVDCGGANANLTFNVNYAVDLNNKVFNYQGQYGVCGLHIASGITASIIGEPADVRGEFLDWGDGGTLMLGDGRAITNANLAGVGDLRGGIVEINNDAAGMGSFGWYVNNGSSTIIGTGNLSDALVQLTGAGATISPGALNGTGTLRINADLQEINNHTLLSFNLGGLNQGAVASGYSWLNVKGTVTLDLQYVPACSIGVKLVGGFMPSLGNTFDVLTASNIVFTAGAGGNGLSDVNFNVPMLPGLAWSESIVTNGVLQSLRFTVVPGPLLTSPPAPLAYLDFNNNLMDRTGNGHNGVFIDSNATYSVNVPNATAGVASLSVPGDNSPGSVSITNTTGISEDDAQSFTLSAWFKISNSADYPTIVKCGNPDTNAPINYYGWFGVDPAGNLTYGVYDIFNLSSSAFVADGNWHHAVVVHDGTAYSYQLYVDGVPDGFGQKTGTDQGANTWDFTIGAAFLAAGNLDEVAYWNQALTPQQVATVYYLGPVPGTPALSISKAAGNNVSLSWLLGGYTLQGNASLTNPAGWTDLGTNPMAVPVGTGAAFFRLKQ